MEFWIILSRFWVCFSLRTLGMAGVRAQSLYIQLVGHIQQVEFPGLGYLV
jgi:hypothetical protein